MKLQIPQHIITGKINQRDAQWSAERAQAYADALESSWRKAIEAWAGTDNLKYSNIYCVKAPANARCVHNLDDNLQRCIFCDNPKDSIL